MLCSNNPFVHWLKMHEWGHSESTVLKVDSFDFHPIFLCSTQRICLLTLRIQGLLHVDWCTCQKNQSCLGLANFNQYGFNFQRSGCQVSDLFQKKIWQSLTANLDLFIDAEQVPIDAFNCRLKNGGEPLNIKYGRADLVLGVYAGIPLFFAL